MDTQAQLPGLPDSPGIGEGWDLLVQAEAERETIDGQRLERIRVLHGAIHTMTAAGVGVKRIAEALSVSPQVVRAVRAHAWQRAAELAPLKERLGRDYLATAAELRAAALERIDEIPAHVLLLASAQAADKGQLLTGAPTARVEHVEGARHADLNAWLDAIPVSAGETSGQKGQAVELLAPAVEASGDLQSPVLTQPHEGQSSDGSTVGQTEAGPVSETESAERETGGRGGASERGGGFEAH